MRKILGCALILAMVLASLAMPDQLTRNAQAQTSTPDPPGRVGRLNYMNGPVSYAPGGVNQWAQATLNYPLTTGTALWTDQNGRAELHIGSTAIRMDETTELDILNLDDQTTQLRVAQGTVDIGLLRFEADERFEVATPSASAVIVRPGHYRFEVDENAIRIIVRKGQVDVETSTGTLSVQTGQAVLVSAGGGYTMLATPAPDDFGRWALARQVDEERALQAATPYVSPAMTGYEDLAPYGTWRHAGGYGAAWFPRVAVGWAPYRHGRWVWASPWGWTWVDEAPWGFAPFHYGRWVVIGGVWAWIPGPIVVRPVFAPALVVFIVIGESIGWFPLAPYEVYVPPYYTSPVYRRSINVNIININITNINITNVRYTYRHEPHAITVVRRGAFIQADRVGGSIIAPRRGDIDRGQLSAGAPLQPRVESVLGRPQGSGGSHRPPAVVERRPVIVRNTPPAPIRPQVSTPGTQMRDVPVRHVNERRDPRAAPQPAPVQPGAVQPAPAQPGQPQPARPAPQATHQNAPQNAPAPQPRPQVGQPGAGQQPAPEPNAVPTPHRRRPNEQAPQPNPPAPPQNAPAPQPPQPNAPAPQPRPQVGQPGAGQQPAPEPNAVPTPHRRRPNEQAPQPNPPAPPQPNAPAPQPRPQVGQPGAGQQPAPEPNAVPTPHRRRPNEQAPQPNAPAPQPQAPGRQPRPPIVQPAPEPNPIPTPHPGTVAPQPRPQQPVVAPPQPVSPPRDQPRVRGPQPAPTPQTNPAPPQMRPGPEPPRNQVRQRVCDERSPDHDPRLCPQNRSRRH